MKTYWDLTEKDRSKLSHEEVERFVDVELMTVGVLRVADLVLEPEPTPPEPDLEVFTVGCAGHRFDCVFLTEEAARAFAKLAVRARSYHYLANDFLYFIEPDTDWKITAEKAFSKNQADIHRNEFAAAKEAKRRNQNAKDEYEKALKAQHDACSHMWSDWHATQAKSVEMDRVADTLKAYQQLAEGDAAVAFRFLRKAFSDSKIAEAVEWCGLELPAGFRLSRDGRSVFEDLVEEARPEKADASPNPAF